MLKYALNEQIRMPRKMIEYRSRLEILSCILHLAKEPTSISRIMLVCNLNWSAARRYIGLLERRRLIRRVEGYEGSRDLYRATAKGVLFTRHMREATSLLKGGKMISIRPTSRPSRRTICKQVRAG